LGYGHIISFEIAIEKPTSVTRWDKRRNSKKKGENPNLSARLRSIT